MHLINYVILNSYIKEKYKLSNKLSLDYFNLFFLKTVKILMNQCMGGYH